MPIDRRSRYARSDRVQWERADGSSVELIGVTPRPPRSAVFSPIATDSDRLDRLAHRYYRDSNKLWKIADASPEIDPFDAVEIGAPVAIPPDK